MNVDEQFARLNRLRVNAGKKELSQWKASPERLKEAIEVLIEAGHSDALPGGEAKPVPRTNDPFVAKARPADTPVNETDKTAVKSQSGLARGLDGNEPFAVHSRKSLADSRRKVKFSEADKRQIKDEARLRKGEIDPKKDPEKAARQKKHIEDKKAKRAAAGNPGKRKEVGKDEITVADIARDLKIDPKIARAKLRRHEDKLTPLHTKGQDRWTFPIKAADAIKKILKG